MRISLIRHPEYEDDAHDFEKWRLTYKGGRRFIARYLQKFSSRENEADFNDRKCISYSPSFAKAGINKLKNTFYSRMCEIIRKDGPESYRTAVNGEGPGVDRQGSSMNAFLGQSILAELMVMKKVGIFIDRNPTSGPYLADNKNNSPYLYCYQAEDILSWHFTYFEGEEVLDSVLLRDTTINIDDKTNLSTRWVTRFRHVFIGEDKKVHVQFYVEPEDAKDENDIKLGEEIILDLQRIPFVLASLNDSLIADVADYQIGLLNIASADMNYAFKANFPFYVEQFDQAAESVYTRRQPMSQAQLINPTDGLAPTEGTRDESRRDDSNETKVGAMKGRKYPKGLNAPTFIAPPTAPLVASMQKQEQMKMEIYELIDIAAANAVPTHASAESKQMDDRGLESGLSYIGLELEYAEREIAKIWAMYENDKPASITYPSKYSLKTDKERVDESKILNDIKGAAPSKTYQKEMTKLIADTMLQEKVTREKLDTIHTEIDKAEFVTSDPEVIRTASELGMVDAVTGSTALGFNGEKVVPLAQKEHADRMAEIAKSQVTQDARGVPDKGPLNKGGSKQEKQKNQQKNPGQDQTRGAGK